MDIKRIHSRQQSNSQHSSLSAAAAAAHCMAAFVALHIMPNRIEYKPNVLYTTLCMEWYGGIYTMKL